MKKLFIIIQLLILILLGTGCKNIQKNNQTTVFTGNKYLIESGSMTDIHSSIHSGTPKKITPMVVSGDKLKIISINDGFAFSLPISCKGISAYGGELYDLYTSDDFFENLMYNEIYCSGYALSFERIHVSEDKSQQIDHFLQKNTIPFQYEENVQLNGRIWRHIQTDTSESYWTEYSGVLYKFSLRTFDDNKKDNDGLALISEFIIPYKVNEDEYHKNDIINALLVDKYNQQNKFKDIVSSDEYGPSYTIQESHGIQSIQINQRDTKTEKVMTKQLLTINKHNKQNVFNRFLGIHQCPSGNRYQTLIYEIKNNEKYIKKFRNGERIYLEGTMDIIPITSNTDYCHYQGLFVNNRTLNKLMIYPGIYKIIPKKEHIIYKEILTGNFQGAIIKDDMLLILDHQGNILKKNINE